MNKLLGVIVAIAASALANLAMAADLGIPVKAAPSAFIPPPPFIWTGFYIGVNAGGSIGRNPTNTFFNGVHDESFIVSPAGFAGGGQIGYNWQLAPTWVFGLEGDFQGTTQKDTAITGSIQNAEGGSTFVLTHRLDWFSTVRARLGYTNGDWLWYVTGGGAWGRITQDFAEFEPAFDGAVSGRHTKSGFAVGGGVETHLWARWTVKVEYLFVDLGNISDSFVDFDTPSNLHTSTSKIEDHIIRAGINYKF